jgi:hypothetical protein
MPFSGSDACPFICPGSYQWVLLVILLDQCGRVYLISRFPGVVGVWVSFPFQEVLQILFTTMMAMTDDGLHLVLRFSLHDVRWRPRVVGAFLFRLLIWS